MDWAKVGARLAAAMADAPAADTPIPVAVSVDRDRCAPEALQRLGIGGPGGGQVGSASLSPAQVSALTDEPWVRRVDLSAPLRPLRPPGEVR